jgi:L-threonylcarbamoyladenylate synthase
MTERAPILKTDGPFLEETLRVLERGGLVISPSTTNYILICDATNERAVDRVFEVKQRTQYGPLGIGVPRAADVPTYVEIPEGFPRGALEALFPGEINLIFRCKYPFPPRLTVGLPTLSVNVSPDPVFGQIALRFGKPLGGTSANISGQGNIFVPIEKAIADLGDKVDLILDGGPTVVAAFDAHPNRSNTIVDFTLGDPWLVREGWVPLARVREFFPNLNTDVEGYKRLLRERVQRLDPKPGAGA